MADIFPIGKHRAYVRQTKQSAAGCLKDSRARHPTEVVVVGIDEAGQLFCNACPSDPGNALYLIELAKLRILGAK